LGIRDSVESRIAARTGAVRRAGGIECYRSRAVPVFRFTREELVDLIRRGALKTPKEQWDRSCKVLDVAGNVAVARAETPWFVDFFHLGKFGDRWVIVNALWYSKRKETKK
jgi:hypothetical protein